MIAHCLMESTRREHGTSTASSRFRAQERHHTLLEYIRQMGECSLNRIVLILLLRKDVSSKASNQMQRRPQAVIVSSWCSRSISQATPVACKRRTNRFLKRSKARTASTTFRRCSSSPLAQHLQQPILPHQRLLDLLQQCSRHDRGHRVPNLLLHPRSAEFVPQVE